MDGDGFGSVFGPSAYDASALGDVRLHEAPQLQSREPPPPPPPAAYMQPLPMGMMPIGPPPGPMGADPLTEIPTGHLLGLSILLPTIGTLAGMRYDPIYGSIGGALAAGSLINAYRAIRFGMRGTEDKEAVISGTYAVLGLAASAYLFMKAHAKKHPEKPLSRFDSDGLRALE